MKAFARLVSIVFVVNVVLGIITPTGEAQQPPQETPRPIAAPPHSGDEPQANETSPADAPQSGSFWMDQKLRLSKELLAGLARADFASLGKNAEVMRGLNRVELFIRREPEGYRDELRLFNMANQAMIRAANEENLEAATLAFNQLTISCVSCHKHLREHP